MDMLRKRVAKPKTNPIVDAFGWLPLIVIYSPWIAFGKVAATVFTSKDFPGPTYELYQFIAEEHGSAPRRKAHKRYNSRNQPMSVA